MNAVGAVKHAWKGQEQRQKAASTSNPIKKKLAERKVGRFVWLGLFDGSSHAPAFRSLPCEQAKAHDKKSDQQFNAASKDQVTDKTVTHMDLKATKAAGAAIRDIKAGQSTKGVDVNQLQRDIARQSPH